MTLRVPGSEMVSTMTLRFGSSCRTRNTPAPPIPSRRLSTVSRCSSMNSCSLGISRATREGTVNLANSAIANFSLCSRSACGALNTRAPSRTAADSSQVLATYSRSNGESLRISTAPNSASGLICDSCLRYQSSSLSVSESRVAPAATRFFAQCRLACSQTCTPCPRAWAARIIATLESLYALSESSGSMMKSRSRLLALGDHELDRGAHVVVGKRRIAAARRHRADTLDGIGDHLAQSFLDERRPGRLVAELRRAGDAGLVAVGADRFVDLLPGAAAGGGAGGTELDPADGLQAFRDRLVGHRIRIGGGTAHHQLHQQDNADDRHHERKHDHHDQLPRRLDEGRMRIAGAHGSTSNKGMILHGSMAGHLRYPVHRHRSRMAVDREARLGTAAGRRAPRARWFPLLLSDRHLPDHLRRRLAAAVAAAALTRGQIGRAS